ncbi:N-methyl-L-tryptophan oxidase [Pseudomonas alloputida]|uniref:N-methyl-L-tryptophan oxidase n=1 Tax=Pseudomonas TaxID=286 RepID=UPI000D8803A0|nr:MULTISPECIES: N-methyl-L-tryptophan oxidase [Pseudomonas]EKT4503529.1 N-methyl-L-tryptophan oxidase [Pseudomonas putida]MCE1061109.1 N-methyl-L-tryptophan oxidase [Pseudomonas alloputida]PYB97444.1 N-methyl-L-tryptophan oxidase [Pseudomonas sp. MB-090624]
MLNSSGETIVYDVAVVGLGAMGAAALYQSAKLGASTIGIDRFVPPHTNGSSHGGSRVTREAVGEGPAYVPLAQRSHRILEELERETGEPLLIKSGTLIVGSPMLGATPLHGAQDFLESSIKMAEQFNIPHEILDAAALRQRYPEFKAFRDTDRGYLEPNSGYMRPEALIKTQLDLAAELGAHIRTNTIVTALEHRDGIVHVSTSDGSTVRARKVVACAGAWSRNLLGAPFDKLLTVTRQVLHWYAVEDASKFDNMPVFIWFVTDRLEDYFTGFPIMEPAEGIKMVASRDTPDIDHEGMDKSVAIEESLDFYDKHVGPNMNGVLRKVMDAGSCLYTNTPDNGFIIDDHPHIPGVFVVSACSGHGFKHSAAIGEAVAQRLYNGKSQIDLSAFTLKRFI